MPREKTGDVQIKTLIAKFIAMRPGDSFFIPNVEPGDVAFLRRPVLRAGCNIKILRVEEDEIYLQPGVRIWREAGEYDQL